MERRCGPNFWKKGLITVVKEVQSRIFLVYKFFPLANLVSPPLIIDSPSALVPSPHNWSRKIVVVGYFGRLTIARRLEMAGLGGVAGDLDAVVRSPGHLNWVAPAPSAPTGEWFNASPWSTNFRSSGRDGRGTHHSATYNYLPLEMILRNISMQVNPSALRLTPCDAQCAQPPTRVFLVLTGHQASHQACWFCCVGASAKDSLRPPRARPPPQPHCLTSGLLSAERCISQRDGRGTHFSATDASLPLGWLSGGLQRKSIPPHYNRRCGTLHAHGLTHSLSWFTRGTKPHTKLVDFFSLLPPPRKPSDH